MLPSTLPLDVPRGGEHVEPLRVYDRTGEIWKTRKKAGGFINQELFSSPFQGRGDNAVADSKVFSSEVFNKRPDPIK
jgi:hypothetical protein